MRSNAAALRTCALILCASLSGCASDGSESAGDGTLRTVNPPAATGAAQPNLAAATNGDVVLSWLEPDGEDAHALRFATLEGETWSEARTVAVGEDFFVNWADFPSVVPLAGGALAAHWLVRSGPGTYAYDIHLARSEDGGASWTDPLVPHRDGTETEHGFVSLFGAEDGDLRLIWLDGRDFAAGDDEPEMSLRYASFGPEGERGREALLDDRVCDCCQTSVALTANGPVAVYRDRSGEEIRDISVIRRSGGEWTDPRPVHRDGWHIPACPVNGPTVAARDRRVAVAWYTAADDRPLVRVAFSDDAGESFEAPIRVDTGRPTGRVDVALLPDGSALVTWIETVEREARILARRVAPDGTPDSPRAVAASTEERPGGFPQMEVAGDRIVFAWTEPDEPSRIGAAVLPLATFQP